MSSPAKPIRWTFTFTLSAPALARRTLKAQARRWGLTALALLAAYWLGTANADDTTAHRPPAPASATVPPSR
ncbi:hypothetical protein [Streptomyces sp. NPDC017529]|uniref:hypothetical protein n=1 Tax=Streptomyces sp. NPDC017529 TaxID=3365000 RepID=UPI00379B84EC